jgi:hypothetical protein
MADAGARVPSYGKTAVTTNASAKFNTCDFCAGRGTFRVWCYHCKAKRNMCELHLATYTSSAWGERDGTFLMRPCFCAECLTKQLVKEKREEEKATKEPSIEELEKMLAAAKAKATKKGDDDDEVEEVSTKAARRAQLEKELAALDGK